MSFWMHQHFDTLLNALATALLLLPYVFAIHTLMRGGCTHLAVRKLRQWVLLAWCVLTVVLLVTLPITLSNLALLPWLATTALLHALIVTEKRGVFAGWALLLSGFPLLLVVFMFYGITWLVAALGILLIALFVWRSNALLGTGRFSLLSREVALLLNNVLLIVMIALLLLASFALVSHPALVRYLFALSLVLLFWMALAPHMQWVGGRFYAFLKHRLPSLLVFMLVMSACYWHFGVKLSIHALLGLALGLWVIIHSLSLWVSIHCRWPLLRFKLLPKHQWGMLFAHIGLAIGVITLSLSLPIHWVIASGLLMGLGGLFSIADKRYRVKHRG